MIKVEGSSAWGVVGSLSWLNPFVMKEAFTLGLEVGLKVVYLSSSTQLSAFDSS